MPRVISTPGELLEELRKCLFRYQPGATESLRHNGHMNDLEPEVTIDRRVVDAVLVDFINYVGACYGVDYAMNTSDLPSPGVLDRMAKASGEV